MNRSQNSLSSYFKKIQIYFFIDKLISSISLIETPENSTNSFQLKN